MLYQLSYARLVGLLKSIKTIGDCQGHSKVCRVY
jgi:hypothetical protein